MLAKHKETCQLVAIKTIDKQAHDYRVMSRLVREIHLMELLDHPNIVKLYETYETSDSLFLIMEYVSGYNLDEYLHQRGGVLSETEARYLFRQLVQAVHACHRHWVVHRDLKTPNIMISKDQRKKIKGEDGTEVDVPVLKLADFGLGNRFGLQRLRTICGSMLYYSPEIISNQKYYGPEVDCWCLGIALFRMTAGFEPFAHAHTVGELKRDVCSCNFPMPASLGPELQNTILKCLQVDRRKRMTVRNALHNDPWLTKNGELPCPLETPTIYDELIHTQQQEGGELTAKDKERRTRRQLMKTLEQEQPQVKRTIIYHPINASTYFTTVSLDQPSAGTNNTKTSSTLELPINSTTNNTSSTVHTPVHRYDRHITNVESHRSELLQSIRQKTGHLGLRSTEKWQKMIMVRPQQFLQLKSKTNPISDQQSTKLFSWMMQRIQDQVYYFQVNSSSFIGKTCLVKQPSNGTPLFEIPEIPKTGSNTEPPLPSLTLSSITTTGSIDEPLDSPSSLSSSSDSNGYHTNYHQLDKECMELLKQTCQLMGITYYQEGPKKLICVLTLRDAPHPQDQQPPQQQSQQQSLQRRSSKHSTASTQRSSTSTSTSNTTRSENSRRSNSYEELILGGGGTYPSSTRLPLISHLTSSMTTSFFGRNKQKQQQPSINDPSENEKNAHRKKDGVAVFSMTWETLLFSPTTSMTSKHRPVIALRFSKIQGSSTVFKMAGGWITGVIGLEGKLSNND
ncbi:kinase-like domain-containing protein [Halteromyces radiatus]|uniref:kinase-like domain-containing protein n=1 Tax=Halteromyces radiatus TaxID=101107 RepID=UPI002220223B|nr:kinase-like domain-containing protein [Halteromyces radiatus]KAI8076328.1 kinase-like domain-containing protein [Halteromyces radiatus]